MPRAEIQNGSTTLDLDLDESDEPHRTHGEPRKVMSTGVGMLGDHAFMYHAARASIRASRLTGCSSLNASRTWIFCFNSDARLELVFVLLLLLLSASSLFNVLSRPELLELLFISSMTDDKLAPF